jgi:hypothetical protein
VALAISAARIEEADPTSASTRKQVARCIGKAMLAIRAPRFLAIFRANSRFYS